jgi:hypothetical protein
MPRTKRKTKSQLLKDALATLDEFSYSTLGGPHSEFVNRYPSELAYDAAMANLRELQARLLSKETK